DVTVVQTPGRVDCDEVFVLKTIKGYSPHRWVNWRPPSEAVVRRFLNGNHIFESWGAHGIVTNARSIKIPRPIRDQGRVSRGEACRGGHGYQPHVSEGRTPISGTTIPRDAPKITRKICKKLAVIIESHQDSVPKTCSGRLALDSNVRSGERVLGRV